MTTAAPSLAFLRRTLAVDAATCAGTGALLLLFAGRLAPLLGLPEPLLYWAGAALLPCAALMLYVRGREALPRALAWLIVAGNAAWVLGSIAVLFAVSPNGLGVAFVLAQAVVVAVLAELELAGLRKAA